MPSPHAGARAAQLNRSSSLMRCLCVVVAALSVGEAFAADQRHEYDVALAKWHAAAVQSYTFTYQWNGAVVVAPACADSTIRVRVKKGVASQPTVVRGNRRCRRGTRGEKAIGFSVPSTIDEAFAEMLRYIDQPRTQVRIEAVYDDVYGVPKSYFVEKLEITDSDEGFKITSFEIAR